MLHDFRSYADHVSVANLAALDDPNDGHARGELTGQRVHAQDPDIGGFKGFENGRRRGLDRPRTEIFQ